MLVRGLGAVFVERFDVQRSAEHADELVRAPPGDGVSLIVFPEGTLMRHTGLMPFRAGAFQVAAQAGIPVVPVVAARRALGAARRDLVSAARTDRRDLRRRRSRPKATTGTRRCGCATACAPRSCKHCGEPDLAA